MSHLSTAYKMGAYQALQDLNLEKQSLDATAPTDRAAAARDALARQAPAPRTTPTPKTRAPQAPPMTRQPGSTVPPPTTMR